MKHLYTLLQFFGFYIVIAAFSWLLVTFVNIDPNPFNWEQYHRFLMVLVPIPVAFAIVNLNDYRKQINQEPDPDPPKAPSRKNV